MNMWLAWWDIISRFNPRGCVKHKKHSPSLWDKSGRGVTVEPFSEIQPPDWCSMFSCPGRIYLFIYFFSLVISCFNWSPALFTVRPLTPSSLRSLWNQFKMRHMNIACKWTWYDFIIINKIFAELTNNMCLLDCTDAWERYIQWEFSRSYMSNHQEHHIGRIDFRRAVFSDSLLHLHVL